MKSSSPDTLIINEIFFSIQGESTLAGLPCVFVRLTSCDLRCVWCDTAYAFHEGTEMMIDAILNKKYYDMSEIKLNNGLGRKIKSYIERKGMKQSFVAFNANISNSHLSNVLCDRVLITPEVLRDINTVLETDFSLENSIITS